MLRLLIYDSLVFYVIYLPNRRTVVYIGLRKPLGCHSSVAWRFVNQHNETGQFALHRIILQKCLKFFCYSILLLRKSAAGPLTFNFNKDILSVSLQFPIFACGRCYKKIHSPVQVHPHAKCLSVVKYFILGLVSTFICLFWVLICSLALRSACLSS